MSEVAIIAHHGKPCDPPIVDGIEFVAGPDGLWLARCPEEVALDWTRNPAYRRFGGAPAVVPDALGPVEEGFDDGPEADPEAEGSAPSGPKRGRRGRKG